MPSSMAPGVAQSNHLKIKSMATLGTKFHPAASKGKDLRGSSAPRRQQNLWGQAKQGQIQGLPPTTPAGDLLFLHTGTNGTTSHVCYRIQLGNASKGPAQCLARGSTQQMIATRKRRCKLHIFLGQRPHQMISTLSLHAGHQVYLVT